MVYTRHHSVLGYNVVKSKYSYTTSHRTVAVRSPHSLCSHNSKPCVCTNSSVMKFTCSWDKKSSYLHWSAYDHKLGFKTYIETRNLTDVR